MKKLIVALLTAAALVVSAGAVDLYVDTVKLEPDSPPVIVDGRTLVPVRAIFEALGAEVEWDADTRTATGTRGDTTVSVQIDNTTAYVNGESRVLDVPARLINNRTMVPARFISESFGCQVFWDQATQTVRVASKLYTVTRVVDGDTIVVDIDGTAETVRLIGVDTPESVHPDADKNTEAGVAASDYTKAALEGKEVELELDVQERDKYGRLLAYVYLDGVMYNKTLLEEGVADIATYPPNVKYVDDFKAIVAARNDSAAEDTTPSTPSTPSTSNTSSTPSVGHTSGTYIASKESDKYHKPTCRHAKKITADNEIWFVSAEEAATAGYSPCGTCKPK